MKKPLILTALALTGALALASCGPTMTTPTPPPATEPTPTPAPLRYSVTPGAPVAVSVAGGDTVTVSRSAGVSSVQIRWNANPALTYVLSDQLQSLNFKASAGLVGEYYAPEKCAGSDLNTCWAAFLRVDRP